MRIVSGKPDVKAHRIWTIFDWDHDGTCDHVGIVERCDGTTVYTVEGNSGDAVRERSYAIHSDSIMGYGMVVY